MLPDADVIIFGLVAAAGVPDFRTGESGTVLLSTWSTGVGGVTVVTGVEALGGVFGIVSMVGRVDFVDLGVESCIWMVGGILRASSEPLETLRFDMLLRFSLLRSDPKVVPPSIEDAGPGSRPPFGALPFLREPDFSTSFILAPGEISLDLFEPAESTDSVDSVLTGSMAVTLLGARFVFGDGYCGTRQEDESIDRGTVDGTEPVNAVICGELDVKYPMCD